MSRVLILLFLICPSVFGYASYSGWCENGGAKVTVQGLSSTATFQQSYPNSLQSATGPNVTVYLTGTTTKATIYSDNSGTPLSNPFPCSSTGRYGFYAPPDIVDILFSGTGISSFTRTGIGGSSLVEYVTNFGAIANGTGPGGTDQASKVQATYDAVSAAGGGTVVFPAATLAYAVDATIVVPSNVTTKINAGAHVQKLHGAATGPVFQAGDATAAVSNIWFIGEGTSSIIDGNRDNISFAGDGYQQGIDFAGCTNCGVQNLLVENAATGGISVRCYNTDQEGNNVQILNAYVTNSKRNNLELICGTGTQVIGGRLWNSNGGSLNRGIDIEPFASGQLVSPVSIIGVEIDHNEDEGIGFTGDTSDPNMQLSLIDNYVHDNSNEGVTATTFFGSSPGNSGNLQIIGGSYLNNNTSSDVSAIQFGGWSNVTISTTTGGNARGIDASSNNGRVSLGPGFISGTLYDVSIDGPNAIARLDGAVLDPAHTLIQPGEEGNVLQPMFGLPINFTANGLAYWPSLTGTVNTSGTAVTCSTGTCGWTLATFPNRQISINSVTYPVGSVNSSTSLTLLGSGAGTQTGVSYFPTRSALMNVATYCGIADTSTFPNLYCNDGTIKVKMQPITGSSYGKIGTETNHPIVIMSNNATPGTAGAVELSVSAGKTIINVASLPTSCSGLSSNTLWNNSGVISICP